MTAVDWDEEWRGGEGGCGRSGLEWSGGEGALTSIAREKMKKRQRISVPVSRATGSW